MEREREGVKLVVSSYTNSGCRYEWCTNMPRITVVQFMVGFVLGTVGYPFCLTLSASIFSKIIGATNTVISSSDNLAGVTVTVLADRECGWACLPPPVVWPGCWDLSSSLRSTSSSGPTPC